MVIDVDASTALAKEIFAPVEVMATEPAVDFTVAFVAVEIWPEPERVMFPVAWIAPVGATELPPEIESVPLLAVSEPAPS